MNKKKIIFEGTDVAHAALVLRLRQLKVSQGAFFRFFLDKFLSEDKTLEGFTESLISDVTPLGKRTSALLKKSSRKGKANLASAGLTQEERDNIFDILEMENFE